LHRNAMEYLLQKGAQVNLFRYYLEKNENWSELNGEATMLQETSLHMLLSQHKKLDEGEERKGNVKEFVGMVDIKMVRCKMPLKLLSRKYCVIQKKQSLGNELLQCLKRGWFCHAQFWFYPPLIGTYFHLFSDMSSWLGIQLPSHVLGLIANFMALKDFYPPARVLFTPTHEKNDMFFQEFFDN
ncbi:hypothetical protein RFI_16992, partial [Reticulomyxa filosa]